MDAIRVNKNTRVNQVSSRTHFVRSDSNLIDFFIGDKMKLCTKCHKPKILSEFHIDRTKKDGHRPDCKICDSLRSRLYAKTEKGRASHKRSNNSEKGKASRKRYSQTEKGKLTQKASHERTYTRYPERRKAIIAVNNAVKLGKIPNIKTRKCYFCYEQAQQYHHYKGYELKFWLDVIPTCRKCHRYIHKIGA